MTPRTAAPAAGAKPGAAATAKPAARPPGRPRDVRCDNAIVSATLQILAETGTAGLTMEAVAARAGVGKATLYRRWSSKESLVVDALATLHEEVAPAASGMLRDDLLALLDVTRRKSLSSLSGRILPRLIAEYNDTPEVMDLYRRRVTDPRRRRMTEVLERAVDAGELRGDLDVDMMIDMMIGPITYRNLFRYPGSVTAAHLEAIVDIALNGARARS